MNYEEMWGKLKEWGNSASVNYMLRKMEELENPKIEMTKKDLKEIIDRLEIRNLDMGKDFPDTFLDKLKDLL